MKKVTHIIVSLFCLVFVSCYKDLSTEADKIIPDIVITGLPEELNVVYGEEITLSVKAYMGAKTGDQLEYLWEVDITANDGNPRAEIGTESTLVYKVNNTPSVMPYLLDVRVTDSETGLQAIKSCKMSVGSSLGEGILVGYTNPDGVTSEFDIIASPQLTYGFTGSARVTRGLYARSNGEPFPEKLTCLNQTLDSDNAVFNEPRILVGSENHVTAIDPLTFTPREKDIQLFSTKNVTSFSPSVMFNWGGYASTMFIGGKCFSHLSNIDNVFAKMPESPENPLNFTPYNVGSAALQQGIAGIFNEIDGKFYAMTVLQVMGGGMAAIDATGAFSFPTDNAKCLMGGGLRGMRLGFLIKDKNNEYHIVIAEQTNTGPVLSAVDFVGEKIEDAVSIAFCDNADLVFYATDDAIYSTVISGNITQNKKLSWKPASADEKITRILQYKQAWYGTGNQAIANFNFLLPTHRSMLIIVTQNSVTGEGKIYLRGFNVSTGLFTFNGDYGSFGGFGDITAICTTLR